ncbi:alkylphosphocholine resistance protein lem3, partial [Linderina pennispora]
MAGGTEGKSKRPSNTAFKQQRLRAWQPLLTPKSVLPTFFIIGIIFAPIGGWLLWASERINEMRIDYTHCSDLGSVFTDLASDKYDFRIHGVDSSSIKRPQEKYDTDTNTCSIMFNMPKDLEPTVFLYYRLTNFYQNHRRYARSFDSDQLKGKHRSASDIKGGDCDPLDVQTINGVRKPIFPCGLIANSMFNDTISKPLLVSPSNSDSPNVTYEMTEDDISWSADRKRFNPTSYKPEDV